MAIDNDDDSNTAEQAEEAAAFEASFEGVTSAKEEIASPAESVVATPEAAAAEPTIQVTPTHQEAAPPAPSPKVDEPDLRAEVRKLHGRIGALNDQLQQTLKAKETEGKPAVLSSVQLTRLKAEYPEMADMLEVDIAEAVRGMAHKATDPKEIENLVSKRVDAEIFTMRQEAITDRHDTWQADCWADQPGGTRTAPYQAWLNTMAQGEAEAFESSMNPAFVNRKLDQFYDWKNKLATAETEKKQRLKAALTPSGTARASPQTMSDAEAERKAFEEEFHR